MVGLETMFGVVIERETLVSVPFLLSSLKEDCHVERLTPRSRRKDARITTLETAAAARISPDAKIVRRCWEPFCWITDATRQAVMIMLAMLREKRAEMRKRRWRGMLRTGRMIAKGKTTSRTSVMMSAIAMVHNCAYALRQ